MADLRKDHAPDLARSLENCMSAIRHARNLGLPIAFTRQADGAGIDRKAGSVGMDFGF